MACQISFLLVHRLLGSLPCPSGLRSATATTRRRNGPAAAARPATELKDVIPVLPARDVSQAVQFYVERLGFELVFQDSEHDPRCAGVCRRAVGLHLQFQFEKDFTAGTAIYCLVQDDLLVESLLVLSASHGLTSHELLDYDNDGCACVATRDTDYCSILQLITGFKVTTGFVSH
jgi:hypothetical protein